jgi:hypothetical protein
MTEKKDERDEKAPAALWEYNSTVMQASVHFAAA